jgi:hypothetical protein
VLAIWSKDEGFLTYNCARCGVHGCAHERSTDWRKRIPHDLPRRSAPIAVLPDDGQARRIEGATSIWDRARDISGTPAEIYLTSRKLDVSENWSHVLRFSGSLSLDGKPACGMVALMRDVGSDAPCGVHRTFLQEDGRPILDDDGNKIRRMLGRAKGAAIKLDAHEDIVSGVHIGEGIETCLAARQRGYRPVWAMGSAGAIADFPVLAGIESLSVLGENDRASTDAAHEVCARYEAQGCETFLYQPRRGDFNDTLKGAA